MQSDNDNNDDLDDVLHDAINYALYINETPKFSVYDVIYLNPDQLKLSLLNPLHIAPINQKNNDS